MSPFRSWAGSRVMHTRSVWLGPMRLEETIELLNWIKHKSNGQVFFTSKQQCVSYSLDSRWIHRLHSLVNLDVRLTHWENNMNKSYKCLDNMTFSSRLAEALMSCFAHSCIVISRCFEKGISAAEWEEDRCCSSKMAKTAIYKQARLWIPIVLLRTHKDVSLFSSVYVKACICLSVHWKKRNM